jgi:hypothetical protein
MLMKNYKMGGKWTLDDQLRVDRFTGKYACFLYVRGKKTMGRYNIKQFRGEQ